MIRRLPRVLTVAEANAIAGTLSDATKLPGYSYGLDAETCQLAAQRRGDPRSICHQANCYARHGAYDTHWVRAAQNQRFTGLKHPRWVDAMVLLIHANCCPPGCRDHTSPLHYFRWHDSGDLQGVWHLENIVRVCELTPTIKHWLPTKEQDHVADFIESDVVVPDNLNIVIGEHIIDAAPTITRPELAHLPTSTVQAKPGRAHLPVIGKGSIVCRAEEKWMGKCGPCRACWDPRVTNVSYRQH